MNDDDTQNYKNNWIDMINTHDLLSNIWKKDSYTKSGEADISVADIAKGIGINESGVSASNEYDDKELKKENEKLEAYNDKLKKRIKKLIKDYDNFKENVNE